MYKIILDLNREELDAILSVQFAKTDTESLLSYLMSNYDLRYYTEYLGGINQYVIESNEDSFQFKFYCGTLYSVIGKACLALKTQSVMIKLM